VSAQAKPISEVVKDFEESLENLRPSTRRVYVAGARADALREKPFPRHPTRLRADRRANICLASCHNRPRHRGRPRSGGGPRNRRRWTTTTTRTIGGGGNSLIVIVLVVVVVLGLPMGPTNRRRARGQWDMALNTYPRYARRLAEEPLENGQKTASKIEGREVLLWDTAIEEPCFASSSLSAGMSVWDRRSLLSYG
jgi:hypothetical protein